MLGELEAVITRIVDERIAAALAKLPAAPAYASNNLPPDCPSRRAFADACRRIPGAKKLGKSWVVDRAAWEAHRARPRRSARDIDDLICAAGYRPTTKRFMGSGG